MASAVSADRVRVRVFRGLLRARAPRVRSHVRFITIPVPVFTLNKQNIYLTESNTVYTGKAGPQPSPPGPISEIGPTGKTRLWEIRARTRYFNAGG